MRPMKSFILIVGLALLSFSCGPKYVYEPFKVNPPFDNSFIKKIAVVEFSNYTKRYNAGRIIADKIEQVLVENSKYEVISRMELHEILREHRLSTRGTLASSNVRRIGMLAGVDALVVGNIERYEIKTRSWKENYGNFVDTLYKRTATVSFTFKVINTTTGKVVWSRTTNGNYFREANRMNLNYLNEISDHDYYRFAIADAMKPVWGLFPHYISVKRRVNKK
jgi:curli biogenesis system outer membrane secretion channel CsgG